MALFYIASTIFINTLTGDSKKSSITYCYRLNRNIWKSDDYIKSNKEKKQRTDTNNKAKKIEHNDCTYIE